MIEDLVPTHVLTFEGRDCIYCFSKAQAAQALYEAMKESPEHAAGWAIVPVMEVE